MSFAQDDAASSDVGKAVPLSERLALHVPEAVAVSGIGRTTLFSLIKTKELPSVKRGGRRLILRADLERFLSEGAAA